MRFVSALCFALLLASCGSRSALLDGTSAAGTGGTAASAGTGAVAGFGGSTGGGGVGAFGGGGIGAAGGGGVGAFGGGGTGAIGGSTQCFGLYPFEPSAEVQHDGGWSDGPPQLAFSSDDAQQLSVAFVTAKTSGTTRQTRHVSFAPWQVWPPPLPIGPAYSTFISPELSPDFALGSSTNGHIALAVAHVPVGGKPFVSFAPEVSAMGGAAGGNVTLPSAGSPVFVSRGPAGQHLVGVSDGNMLQASIVQSFGTGFNVTPVLLLACGQNAKIADAAPFASGWVVALANEKTAPPPPSCSAAANGPMRLDVVFVSPDGAVSSVLAMEEPMAIGRVAVAPHPTGAYVVWHVTSGGKVAPLRFMRVDVGDASAWGPVDVSGPSDLPLDDFDVAALGPTAAAIAWGNDPAGNPPDLMVTVLSDSGNPMASLAFEPSFFGPLAIAGDPAGQSLVVGWREQTATGGEAGVRLRRLGCFGED